MSGTAAPDGGASLWGSGFLPTIHQGVQLRSQGDPVLFLSNPDGMDAAGRRQSLDALKALNQLQLEAVGDPEIVTRIAQYELAYRMQTSVPEVMDIAKETKETHEMYGVKPGQKAFANNCLLARRLVESGVRFVQLYHWGWDSHGESQAGDLRYGLVERCKETDQPIAALIKDLKQRGLLDTHAGRLGRRVRPDADERGAQRLEVAGPRPPPARLHDLDGRRRHQAGLHARRPPTNSAITSPRTASTSTTCRRRSCT